MAANYIETTTHTEYTKCTYIQVCKIFIDIHGNINLCENFLYGNFFGNVNSKIEIKNRDILLENYKKTRETTCKQCWASKMCSLCFRDIFDSDCNINLERASFLCKQERKFLKAMLIDYCYIMEKDKTILDHLNDYIISF